MKNKFILTIICGLAFTYSLSGANYKQSKTSSCNKLKQIKTFPSNRAPDGERGKDGYLEEDGQPGGDGQKGQNGQNGGNGGAGGNSQQGRGGNGGNGGDAD